MHSHCASSDLDDGCAEVLAGAAARSLALLQAIELTVTSLASDTEVFNLFAKHASDLAKGLVETEHAELLDKDGATAAKFKAGAEAIARLHARAIRRRDAARKDGRLTDEDGVEDAFDAYIASLADFHNEVESLRELMENLDSLKEPALPEVFTDVDALIASLKA